MEPVTKARTTWSNGTRPPALQDEAAGGQGARGGASRAVCFEGILRRRALRNCSGSQSRTGKKGLLGKHPTNNALQTHAHAAGHGSVGHNPPPPAPQDAVPAYAELHVNVCLKTARVRVEKYHQAIGVDPTEREDGLHRAPN